MAGMRSRSRVLAKRIRPGSARLYEPAEQPEQNDLAYKDVIFDLEIRSFLHSEYADKELNPAVFHRLMHAIEQHEAPRRRYARQTMRQSLAGLLAPFKHRLAALYRTAGRAGTQHALRMLSGGLAAIFIIVAMWPLIISTLAGHGGVNHIASNSPIASELAPTQDAGNSTLQQGLTAPPLELPKQQAIVGTPNQAEASVMPPAISTGLMSEDRRLQLEKRFGEDLSSSRAPTSPTNPPNDSAANGTDTTLQSPQGDGQMCPTNKLCAR